MYYSSDAELSRIALGLSDRTLPKSEWTHAAHFAAAIWLLSAPGVDAFAKMPDLIRRYNEATGVQNTDSDGYHETITIASLKAAKSFLENGTAERPLYEIVNMLLDSEYGKSNWLLTHWSRECLFSVEARRTWVAPDLAALPFD